MAYYTDAPIWMFAYFVNNETGSRLVFKPTLGEISSEGGSCDRKFIPYKRGTTQRRTSGFLRAEDKSYAHTQEEAIREYNQCVQERIDRLEKMIIEAESHILPVLNEKNNECIVYEAFLNPPPQNTAIWAFAYRFNNKTNGPVYFCKPVQGEVFYEKSAFRGHLFAPYKEGTNDKKLSSAVGYNARFYTMTKEEAITSYNALVEKRIMRLNELRLEAINDLI